MIKNIGLIHEDIRETDHFLGTEDLGGDLWAKILPEVGGTVDWTPYEPTLELQKKDGVETNACVSFSKDNQAEYVMGELMSREPSFKNFLSLVGMLDENGKPNCSDRRTAKGSGTDPNRGNSVRAVEDYFRNFLFCPENLWPFPAGMSRDEFYAIMPDSVANWYKKVKEMISLNDKYLPISYPNYNPDVLMDGLQYSPIWVSVKVPYCFDGDKIKADDEMLAMLKADQRPYGHRILVRKGVRGQYFECHDNYQNQFIKFDYNYPFGDPKIMRINWLGDDMEDVIQVGKDLYVRAKGGKYQNEYFIFEDGDVAKAISPNGDYSGLKPRTKLGNPPAQFKGNVLGLKKKLTFNSILTYLGL